MRLSYHYNGNSYTGKMTCLYWAGPQVMIAHCLTTDDTIRADSILCPANERRRYFVMTSLIGWVQTWNQPCTINHTWP